MKKLKIVFIIIVIWGLMFGIDYLMVTKLHKMPLFEIKLYEHHIVEEYADYYEKEYFGIGYGYYIRVSDDYNQFTGETKKKELCDYRMIIIGHKMRYISIGINE